jgi:hypothetical protein
MSPSSSSKRALFVDTASYIFFCWPCAGAHDGIGAVVKRILRAAENHGHRLYNTEAAALYLEDHLQDPETGPEFTKNWSVYRVAHFQVM